MSSEQKEPGQSQVDLADSLKDCRDRLRSLAGEIANTAWGLRVVGMEKLAGDMDHWALLLMNIKDDVADAYRTHLNASLAEARGLAATTLSVALAVAEKGKKT